MNFAKRCIQVIGKEQNKLPTIKRTTIACIGATPAAILALAAKNRVKGLMGLRRVKSLKISLFIRDFQKATPC